MITHIIDIQSYITFEMRVTAGLCMKKLEYSYACSSHTYVFLSHAFPPNRIVVLFDKSQIPIAFSDFMA